MRTTPPATIAIVGLATLLLSFGFAFAVQADEPPVAVSPGADSGAVIQNRCPTFSWSATEEARGYELAVYRVEVRGEENTVPFLTADTDRTLTANTELVAGIRLPAGTTSWSPSLERCLDWGGRYAWSVRAVDGTDRGAWSEASLFRVSGTPSVTEVEAAIETLKRFLERGREAGRGASTDEPNGSTSATAREALQAASGGNRSPEEREWARDRPERTVSASSGLQAETAAAAPIFGTPSLTVDANLALGASSNVFKDGQVFLWNDTSGNLALGTTALESASGDATHNTAVGSGALRNTTQGSELSDGSSNTALGPVALYDNSFGHQNTAIGPFALFNNTTGSDNTAIGPAALYSNTYGGDNTAIGPLALHDSTSGYDNTAVGVEALSSNTIGILNNAVGDQALRDNTEGHRNTAMGNETLASNTTGHRNVAIGHSALSKNTTGYRNIAIGNLAGAKLGDTSQPTTSLSDNIFIGTQGKQDEEATTRIGDPTTHDRAFIAGIYSTSIGSTNHPVCVDSSGQLGQCPPSSARFKQDMQSLDSDTRQLLDLEPVAFRYRPGYWGGPASRQIGLLAEDVAKVFPELVIRNEDGEPLDVRYERLSVLLLEELRRQHSLIEHQKEEIVRQDALDDSQGRELARLRERIKALEEGRSTPERNEPWWRRIFARDRDSP